MKKNYFMLPALFCSVLLFNTKLNAQDKEAPSDKAAALLAGFQTGQYEMSDYNTACYFALAGNKTAAFVYLQKAVNDGFRNLQTLLNDTDLNTLHSEEGWKKIADQVKQNAANGNSMDQLFFNQDKFWESQAFKTPYRENISDEEKLAGLSKFWSEAKYNFINFDLVPQLDFDSLYISYIPKVKQTKSTLEYYKILMQMCAHLKDAHTNVMVPDELANEVYARPLMRTRLIEDKVIIIQVDEQLVNQGIKKGMEIIRIDDIPVKEYAAKYVEPYQSCSTPQDRDTRKYEYALLAGSMRQTIALEVADEKEKLQKYAINRVDGQERSKKLGWAPIEYKLLNGNIAYFAINSFGTDTSGKFFEAHYTDIAKTNGLIIDLRDNGGGSTDWTILRHLITQQTVIDRTYSRRYIPTLRAWGRNQDIWENKNAITPGYAAQYTKPVILLTSARTFSAAEDFAMAFKALKAGIIIGETTGGSTGQPLFFTLPGNGSARVCTKRDQYADGEDFVGKGVTPDIIVKQTVADFRNGVDTQLEAALKQFKK